MRMPRSLRQSGFSLIEMVVAITVLGILSTSAAVFLRGPITSYFDAERRADLADAGALAMAKLTQDISRAVPDSAGVTSLGGGRYRLRFQLRPPAPAATPTQVISYVCNPTQRSLRRNGILLADDIATCLPLPVLSPSNGGQAQVVSLLLSFDNQGNRLNLAHTIRVEP